MVQGSFSADLFQEIVDPYNPEQLQPASYDLKLGNHFWVLSENESVIIPEKATERYKYIHAFSGEMVLIPPHATVLAITFEKVNLPTNCAAQVSTRSTAMRWGIDVCHAAGWIDPGFNNYIVLELTNNNPKPIAVYPGLCYAQLVVFDMEGYAEKYNGIYNQNKYSTGWCPEDMLPKDLVWKS